MSLQEIKDQSNVFLILLVISAAFAADALGVL